MTELQTIKKVQNEERTSQQPIATKTEYAHCSGSLFAGLKHKFFAFIHKNVATNPYADTEGEPKQDFIVEYYEWELARRKQAIDALPRKEKEKILRNREAFRRRMQS